MHRQNGQQGARLAKRYVRICPNRRLRNSILSLRMDASQNIPIGRLQLDDFDNFGDVLFGRIGVLFDIDRSTSLSSMCSCRTNRQIVERRFSTHICRLAFLPLSELCWLMDYTRLHSNEYFCQSRPTKNYRIIAGRKMFRVFFSKIFLFVWLLSSSSSSPAIIKVIDKHKNRIMPTMNA